MNNRNFRYEERLGQENLLPLIFRMALPAITAQVVNLLYNMVDRIYIGHIPGIGKPMHWPVSASRHPSSF